MNIEDVFSQHEQSLMSTPGVAAIGIGEEAGQPVIVVMLETPQAKNDLKLPAQIEGFPVRIEIAGKIEAFQDSNERFL